MAKLKGKTMKLYLIEDEQGRHVNQWKDVNMFLRAKDNYQNRYEWSKGYRFFEGTVSWEEV